MEDIKLGDRVKVIGKNANGEVAFVGETHFSDGIWLGIVLDEPKGRHNGAVDGTRYFKCSRNHGVFVRACQIVKENLDNQDSNDKPIAVKNKITYPNYLKSSSKLKSDKHAVTSRSAEIPHKSKSLVNSIDEQNEESDNYNPLIKKENDELLEIKKINEDLKLKLKTSEESFKDALQKYAKAIEDIKHLTDELDNRKKQVKVQKYHIKLLKMKQCKHNKRAKKNPFTGHQNGESNSSKIDDEGLNSSDDEFDLESMKSMMSAQRIAELEEQNRIMVQGLVELRDFLKSTRQYQFVNSEEIKRRNMRKTMSSSSNLPGEPEMQLKDYGGMLREMTQFSEIMKENGKLGKLEENSNGIRLQAGDNKHFRNNNSGVNNFVKFKDRLNSETCTDINPEKLLEVAKFHVTPTVAVESLSMNNNFQQNFLTSKTSNAQELQPKLMQKLQMEYMPTSSDASHAVNELRGMISSMMPSSPEREECASNTSLIEQELLVEVRDSSSSKSDSQMECTVPLSGHTITNNSIQSGGDSPMIPSKGRKPKKRMLLSTRVYQRQELTKRN